jgi:hypothetical protein
VGVRGYKWPPPPPPTFLARFQMRLGWPRNGYLVIMWNIRQYFVNVKRLFSGKRNRRNIGLFWRNSGCSTEQKTLRVCRSTDHPKSPEFPAPFPHPCAMPPSPAPMKRYYIEWNRNIDIYLGSLSVIFLSSCRSCGTLSYSLCLKGHGNEPNFLSFLH